MNHVLPGWSLTEALPRWDRSGRPLTVSSFKEALSLGQTKRFTAVESFIIPQPAKCYCRGLGDRSQQAQGPKDGALPPQGFDSTDLWGPAWPG